MAKVGVKGYYLALLQTWTSISGQHYTNYCIKWSITEVNCNSLSENKLCCFTEYVGRKTELSGERFGL